jgi:hypothetical protein
MGENLNSLQIEDKGKAWGELTAGEIAVILSQ